MKGQFTFVEWSHGEMEGTVYDNVVLSDGLLAFKSKNKVNGEVMAQVAPKEGDRVECTFEVRGSKTLVPVLRLTKIEKVK
jgi:hypothetical protein